MTENKAATFEVSLKRLEEIVQALEGDAVSLDRSVALFQEGRELARRCEALLRTAQATIDSAVAGTVAATPARAPKRSTTTSRSNTAKPERESSAESGRRSIRRRARDCFMPQRAAGNPSASRISLAPVQAIVAGPHLRFRTDLLSATSLRASEQRRCAQAQSLIGGASALQGSGSPVSRNVWLTASGWMRQSPPEPA